MRLILLKLQIANPWETSLNTFHLLGSGHLRRHHSNKLLICVDSEFRVGSLAVLQIAGDHLVIFFNLLLQVSNVLPSSVLNHINHERLELNVTQQSVP